MVTVIVRIVPQFLDVLIKSQNVYLKHLGVTFPSVHFIHLLLQPLQEIILYLIILNSRLGH
jgi:hypothetical protein